MKLAAWEVQCTQCELVSHYDFQQRTSTGWQCRSSLKCRQRQSEQNAATFATYQGGPLDRKTVGVNDFLKDRYRTRTGAPVSRVVGKKIIDSMSYRNNQAIYELSWNGKSYEYIYKSS